MYRTTVEESTKNLVVMDVFSKLSQNRIIFIDDVVDDELSNGVIAQLLYLDSLNMKEITIYINTPGGSVNSGLAIYDVANLIKSPIKTVCIGSACSMGLILMLCGEVRVGLKHSRFMLHQINGGSDGKVEDIKVSYEEMLKLQKELMVIVQEKTNIVVMPTADKWYDSVEAMEVGIINERK